MREHPSSLDLRLLVAAIAAWVAGAVIAFRSVVGSSFDGVFGDGGDGRLIVYLHEHLFQALTGHAYFLSPGIFYPQRNVLGFSDAFLLDAVPYAALRLAGLDAYLSFQIWAIALSFLCFMATFIIGIRYLKLRFGFAGCAAALVTFPNNLMFVTAAGHSQFFAVYYVPCIVLLALSGLESFPRIAGWPLVRVGCAAALFGLLFATGYYTAWLFAFTVLIALCVAAIMLRRQLIGWMNRDYKPALRLAAIVAISFAASLVPFALIYLPVYAGFSGRGFDEYLLYAPSLRGVIDVGKWNLVWGRLIERLFGNLGVEATLAVTPIMTGAVIIFAIGFMRGRPSFQSQRPWQPIFVLVCALVWVMSGLLTVRVGDVSLFWLPYHVLPGATAIRAGERIQLLANMWIVCGLAVALQYWIDNAGRRHRNGVALLSGVILAVCLIEQIDLLSPWLLRSREYAWLARVPKPPPECGTFFVTNFDNEMDAMWVSVWTGLPTINGSSGWEPHGWHLEDRSVGYIDGVRQWIADRTLNETACVYDKKARTWSVFDRTARDAAVPAQGR